MTEDEKPEAKPDAKSDHKPELEKDARAEAGPSADTASPDEAQDATSESSEPAQEEVAEPSLEDRLAETNDQLLRALAELENTRRRADRDRAEALKYGAASFARDMLGVADNLQRALGAVAELDQETLPDAAKSLLEGVAATERDLIASLGRHKVQPLSPMGEKFDPNQHEAMFEAPGTGQPAGTIIEVIETGYVMDERLLRPAKVGIAKDD
ncbi:MAG: nucleotide exchange factor GrpE [Rhizobiales bacterium TMED83]|nr:nucleotide exchange factor GrpE [Rhodobiaceae bacterium]RPF94153.1 MAG: nucleotide exchange factor GrpE [Rhizobiales bacterium TMED83]